MVEQRGSRRELGRRGFLGMIGAAVGSVAATGSALTQEAASAQTELDALSFYSAASQIAPDGESELVDEETVVVWAEPTAYNFETTADGPETVVCEDEEIPLISEDGRVVGIGTGDFASDDGGFDLGNEEFLLNLFDAKMGGEGTVLWDEGHDQSGGVRIDGTVGENVLLRGSPTIDGDLAVGGLDGELDQRGNPTINGEIEISE